MEEPGRLQSTGSQRVDMTERLHFHFQSYLYIDSPSNSDGKASACNARDLGSIPGLGRS